MSRHQRLTIAALITLLLLSWAALATAKDGVVPGWFEAGTDPDEYEVGLAETDQGKVAYVRSLDPKPDTFGNLMQTFDAGQYRGKRVRLQAKVRAMDVKNWAGMWLRVDANNKPVAFDNMQDRPLQGTCGWRECTIVLDVPAGADTINMGLLLAGKGRVEWDDISFEIVPKDVRRTDVSHRNERPANLDFDN